MEKKTADLCKYLWSMKNEKKTREISLWLFKKKKKTVYSYLFSFFLFNEINLTLGESDL